MQIHSRKNGLKTILKNLIDFKKEYKFIGIRKEYENILGCFNDQRIIKLNQNKRKNNFQKRRKIYKI